MDEFIELLFLVAIIAIIIFVLSCSIGVNLNMPSPVILGGKSHKKTYDEYDDRELLEDEDLAFIKNINNVVIDGNNFIYRFFEHDGNNGYIGVEQYFSYVEKSIKLLNKILPKKNIFFTLKDPENEGQKQKACEYFKCKTLPQGYKTYFSAILKKYSRVRIVMAYGTTKARDDFAAIWLSDQLGEKTILLSRDRYSDVRNTNENTNGVKFVVYGKHASKYNSLLNKNFAFIDKSSVRISLVGYTFDKKHKTAFYHKKINKQSNASDMVLIINEKS